MAQNIKQVYNGLVDSIDHFLNNDRETDSPSHTDLYIGMIHRLTTDDPSLIDDKQRLLDVLMKCARKELRDEYNDQIDDNEFEGTLDEYIMNEWLESGPLEPQYWHGTDCASYQVKLEKLKQMIKKLV